MFTKVLFSAVGVEINFTSAFSSCGDVPLPVDIKVSPVM